MTDLQKPNSKQAQQGSLAGQLKGALSKWLREEVDDMLPARVVSYDDATNRAVIQPLVMIGTTSGAKVSRASLPNIPVFRFGSGQFFMRFPIKPGDFGWLKANDKDISLIMQAQGQQEDWPNTERLHDFSDAMFFPDCVRGWLIDGANVALTGRMTPLKHPAPASSHLRQARLWLQLGQNKSPWQNRF